MLRKSYSWNILLQIRVPVNTRISDARLFIKRLLNHLINGVVSISIRGLDSVIRVLESASIDCNDRWRLMKLDCHTPKVYATSELEVESFVNTVNHRFFILLSSRQSIDETSEQRCNGTLCRSYGEQNKIDFKKLEPWSMCSWSQKRHIPYHIFDSFMRCM